tara:strand:+ start:938 stop:1141 length:204 start_codon:yes stop_codon:yes gene_type:complete
MPNWEEKLLNEVRADVKQILAIMPTLTPLEEHNKLKLEHTSFRSKVKSVGFIGAIIATIKAVWVYIA